MEEKETTRVEAFSDGIFSIAMTLLVIEIRVPGHDLVAVKGLAQVLLDLWPSYLAFGSFRCLVVGALFAVAVAGIASTLSLRMGLVALRRLEA